jgi:hypothetical protein
MKIPSVFGNIKKDFMFLYYRYKFIVACTKNLTLHGQK